MELINPKKAFSSNSQIKLATIFEKIIHFISLAPKLLKQFMNETAKAGVRHLTSVFTKKCNAKCLN